MKILGILGVLVSVLGAGAGVHGAEMDVAKVLVGAWQGEFTAQGPSGRGAAVVQKRRLTIQSVQAQDGKWVVDKAEFAGRNTGPVTVLVTRDGDTISLEWGTIGTDGKVSANLVGDDTLRGTIQTGNGNYPIWLKKAK